MAQPIKRLLQGLVVLLLIIWLLQVFGLLHGTGVRL
jgi:hypothetical protein